MTTFGKPLAGGCACGAVRYRLNAEPLFTHCCHCRDCQRQSGSAFVLNALIETEHVEIESGAIVVTEMPTGSGRPHDLHRCAACGTALWSDYGRRGYLWFVRVGTLDEPGAIEPDVHIFVRSKLPWVELPTDARVFEEFYVMKEEWPDASQARRARASARASGVPS